MNKSKKLRSSFPSDQREMNYYSFTISFLAICFLASVLIAFHDFTLHDQLLPNKHFKSFPVKDWLKCVQVCHSVPSCISYNYDANSHNSCQLHKCGFRDRCTACGNLYVSAGAIFHQLKPVNYSNVLLDRRI